jgi:hypothetical protein
MLQRLGERNMPAFLFFGISKKFPKNKMILAAFDFGEKHLKVYYALIIKEVVLAYEKPKIKLNGDKLSYFPYFEEMFRRERI